MMSFFPVGVWRINPTCVGISERDNVRKILVEGNQPHVCGDKAGAGKRGVADSESTPRVWG